MTKDSTLWLRDAVADILGEDLSTVKDGDNLFEAGLDSVGLLRLVNRLRREGHKVNFADLAQEPKLAAWAALVESQQGPAPAKTEAPVAVAAAQPVSQGESEPAPLGVMQHAYWAGRDSGQRLSGVAAHLYVEFDQQPTGGTPALDPGRVQTAIAKLVERHETLRTRITREGQQVVMAGQSAKVQVFDLTEASPDKVAGHLADLRERFSHQMLDIEAGEMLAVALTLLPDGATRLHLDVDMVAADAVSYRVLLADFTHFYTTPDVPLEPLGLTYRNYLATTEADKQQRAEAARKAWHARLDSLPGAPLLPEVVEKLADGAKPKVTRRHLWLSPEDKRQLTETARQHGVTVAMTVAAILSEVVGQWSDTQHFLLNVPMFDRQASHPQIDKVVGDFSSSVMLEVDLRSKLSFVERVRALQTRMHADAAHAAYTGLDLLRDLSRQRGQTVLAPVVFTSAIGLGALFSPGVASLVGKPVWIISQGPQVLLDAQVTELDDGLLVNWDTREEALAKGVFAAMFIAFKQALDRVIKRPEAWSEPLPALPGHAASRLLDGRNVRIVDHLGRDRPDHVPGKVVFDADAADADPLWGVADAQGHVTLLGRESEKLDLAGAPVWPAQVEAALRTDPRLRDVAVIRQDDRLVAAVAFDERLENAPGGKALRAELTRIFPTHLLPAEIVVRPGLPRNADGSLDSAALLQSLEGEGTAHQPIAPQTDLERVIAGVWEDVLGLETVGVNEEFIALGGDSLLAARVVARLREELDTNAVTLRMLFRAPTIAEFAEQLKKEDDPARLDEVAAIVLEIRGMSDEEVAALLEGGKGGFTHEAAE